MERYIQSNIKKPEGTDVIYYFYDHLLLRRTGEAQQVVKAVENKDYETFKKIFDKYPPYISEDGYRDVFFPDTAFVRDEDGNILSEIDITTPEGFAMIDEAAFECG